MVINHLLAGMILQVGFSKPAYLPGQWTRIEDVFLFIENADIPACYVSLPEAMLILRVTDSIHPKNHWTL